MQHTPEAADEQGSAAQEHSQHQVAPGPVLGQVRVHAGARRIATGEAASSSCSAHVDSVIIRLLGGLSVRRRCKAGTNGIGRPVAAGLFHIFGVHFAQRCCRCNRRGIIQGSITSITCRLILRGRGCIVGEQIAEHFQGELLEQVRLQSGWQVANARAMLFRAQLVVLIAVVLVAVRAVSYAIAGQLLGDAQEGLIPAGSWS